VKMKLVNRMKKGNLISCFFMKIGFKLVGCFDVK
jgi:hypothetical protein